jgi:hypothetical protein
MNFIKGVPIIKISQNNKYLFNITTVQKFKENEDKVILQCAEDIPEFMRGYICNMDCHFKVVNENCENKYERNSIIKDLVLVYINKDLQYNYMPSFEYIFFK